MSNNPQHESVAQAPGFGYAPQYPEDEIDLFDIWRVLVRQRKLIVIVTVLVSLLAVGYALLAPRVYKAEVFLLPPLGKDVAGLNIPEINEITVELVYAEMFQNLQSMALRRQFFDEQQLAEKLAPDSSEPLEEEKIFSEGFHKLLSVQMGKKDKAGFCTVSLEGAPPEQIRGWLNDFVVMVNGYTVSRLADVVDTKIKGGQQAILAKIEGLRQIATSRRLDRITLLQEQFYIAERLGIIKRKNVSGDFTSKISNTPARPLVIDTAGSPVYLRGTEELQAEIDVLQKRKDDDPFIGALRNLQEELARLEKIELNKDDLKAVRIDRLAVLPDVPIKPKRKMIVVVGTMLGLMLGLFAAFLVNFIETNRDKLCVRSEE